MVRFGFHSPLLAVPITTTKAVFNLGAATNRPFRVERVVISGDSVTSSQAPEQWVFYHQTDNGTGGTSVAAYMNEYDLGTGAGTLQATGLYLLSAVPTGIDEIGGGLVSPLGTREFVYPPGRELIIPGGAFFGITILTPKAGNNWVIDADFAEF